MTIKGARELGVVVEFGVRSSPEQKWHWFPTAHLRDIATQRMLDADKTPERVERWSWPGGTEYVWILVMEDLVGFTDEPHHLRIAGRNGEAETHSQLYANRQIARTAALRHFRRQNRP